MPVLPWRVFGEAEADREYVVVASLLPLRSYVRVPQFVSLTIAIRKQLVSAEGLVGYSLASDVPRKRFWTLSVWTDAEALDRFRLSEAHVDAMRKLRLELEAPVFVVWRAMGGAVPVPWEVARMRIAAAAGEKGTRG